MTEADSVFHRIHWSLRDLLVATAVVAAMIAFPWAAVGLLLLGSVGIALFARRHRRVAAWTFAVVAWLTAFVACAAIAFLAAGARRPAGR